jgi:multiple sugar transport system ATP-binding protein
VRDPVAYLMDDPISALDARLREETRVELKRIQRDLGQTLIYVTHDQEEAMSVADRIAIMENGEIRQVGSPVEIYDTPVSRYVARLLGAPMMNIMSAVRGDGVSAADGTISLPFDAVPADVCEIGVRPEDLKVEPWASERSGRPAKVYEVEPLGGYTVVTVDTGAEKLKALMRGQPDIGIDSAVALSCNPARAHFFNQAGEALVL